MLFQMNALYCKECDIQLTSETVRKQHMEGSRHYKRLQHLKRHGGCGQIYKLPVSNQHYCDLCNVACPDATALQAHREGSTHALALRPAAASSSSFSSSPGSSSSSSFSSGSGSSSSSTAPSSAQTAAESPFAFSSYSLSKEDLAAMYKSYMESYTGGLACGKADAAKEKADLTAKDAKEKPEEDRTFAGQVRALLKAGNCTALQIAQRLSGLTHSSAKLVNPLLYEMEKRRIIVSQPGSPPLWKLLT